MQTAIELLEIEIQRAERKLAEAKDSVVRCIGWLQDNNKAVEDYEFIIQEYAMAIRRLREGI